MESREQISLLPFEKGVAILFSIKGQIVNNLDFTGLPASALGVWPESSHRQYVNKRGDCVAVKFYLQKQAAYGFGLLAIVRQLLP